MGVGGFQGERNSFFETGGGAGVAFGAYASAPATPAVDNDLYISDDGPITKIGVAGAWKDSIPGYGSSDPIPTTGWTADGDVITLSTASGLREVTAAVGDSGGHVRSAATTGFQYTVLVTRQITDTTGGGSALFYLEEEATGESVGIQFTGATTIFIVRRPNGAFNSAGQTTLATLTPTVGFGERFWVRLKYDPGPKLVILAVSSDGVNFLTVLSEAESASFTTAPDRLQFGAEGPSTVNPTTVTMFLFNEVEI